MSKTSLKKWREKNPYKYAFQSLKDNAKRRGKDFKLTFDQFKQFAIEVDYIKKKGIFQKCIHIDRIDEDRGYIIDNIQPLENKENVLKFLDYKYNGQKMEYKNIVTKPVQNEAPF